MKIKLEFHEKYKEPEIHICHDRDSREIRKIYAAIKNVVDLKVRANDGNETVILPSSEIIRIYSQEKRVYAVTTEKAYLLHERLYELEETLDMHQFIRISNSEIVNLQKIKRLDTGLTGTIKMYLEGEQETYVSRRYVTKIKKALGIGGRNND